MVLRYDNPGKASVRQQQCAIKQKQFLFLLIFKLNREYLQLEWSKHMFEAEIQQYDNTVRDYQRVIVEPMGREQYHGFSTKPRNEQMAGDLAQKRKANRPMLFF